MVVVEPPVQTLERVGVPELGLEQQRLIDLLKRPIGADHKFDPAPCGGLDDEPE